MRVSNAEYKTYSAINTPAPMEYDKTGLEKTTKTIAKSAAVNRAPIALQHMHSISNCKILTVNTQFLNSGTDCIQAFKSVAPYAK